MSYRVKEIFHTLQGEGANTGRSAVFLRFTGCNLWSGHEDQRATAVCRFCDTDFVGTDGPGGGVFDTAHDLAAAVAETWPRVSGDPVLDSAAPAAGHRFVVCTGGEPLLQLDEFAVEALHRAGFEIAIETNGTKLPPAGIDWVCMSPKVGADPVLTKGDELKLVYPQDGGDPADYEHLDFDRFCLSPMDSPEREQNTALAVEYCLAHPKWRLTLQTHKYLNIP